MKKSKFTLLLCLFALMCFRQSFAQIPTTGLLGYWPFSGNANDYSGNGKNGIVNGAVLTTDRFGNPNNAYFFNGNNKNISVNSFNIGTQALTVCFWFNTNDKLKNQRMVTHDWDLHGPNGSFSTHISSRPNSNGKEIFAYPGGVVRNSALVQAHVWPPDTISNNIWYFFTLTFDGSALKLYIDNNLVSSNLSTTLLNGTQTLYFGGDAHFPFSGSLDDIGFWGRVLSQAEISNLYYGNVTGLKESEADLAVSIYPNPSQGKCNLQLSRITAPTVGLTVSDLLGRVVLQQELKVTNQRISQELTLPSAKGIYLMQVKAGEQTITRKIVVE